MRRRLLDLCLLAYPRARRKRDRDYVRDLALELSATYGLRRQAISLVQGGLSERIERHRMRSGARVWTRRLAVGCFLVATLVFVASGRTEIAAGDDERVEAGRLVCDDSAGACAPPRRLIAARRRGGWDCAIRSHDRGEHHVTAWRCVL
jgi:hypothetical protein